MDDEKLNFYENDDIFDKKDEKKVIEVEEIPEEVGAVKVADEVLSIVAGLAASEVPGVAGMSGGLVGGITELLGKQNFSKGVKIVTTGKTVNVEIYVIIEYGYTIPDIAIAIQEKVKKAVENMTGFDVTAVDVYVEGIRRRKEIEEANKKVEDLEKTSDKGVSEE